MDAAKRELEEETQLSDFHIKMFGVFDAVDRDPRDRVISISFYAIIPSHNIEVIAGSDAANADWYDFNEIPALAFDHNKIIDLAFKTLTNDLENSSLAAKFLSKEFTLAEFQNVVEIILNKKIDKRNFSKWVGSTDFIIKTENKKSGGQHRPAALYKIKDNENDIAVENSAQISVPDNLPSNHSKIDHSDKFQSQKTKDDHYKKGFQQGFQKTLSNITHFIGKQKPDP